MVKKKKMGIKKPTFFVSQRQYKKYKVITPKGNIVHIGDTRYQHFKDSALGKYSRLNHGDPKRRRNYRRRARGIKNKRGKLTYRDKESANYYAYHYLW